ncbi:hydroxyisourate hydrolase [Aldersonia kunmingensis]|uniref:hydroxyisourate hydrolase n=1 Tax=Aldersonia kunmingensis TaxID=408066 RepID=UPI000835C630|nr:hydroxyisourate hydrolase [Aldersonia kunmingensis]
MSSVSTHVLDTALGKPAAGVALALFTASGTEVARARTDADGRVGELLPDLPVTGDFWLVFATGAYFTGTGRTGFYPEVTISFSITEPDEHYHVPLLLSPYAYSTYRGS